MYASVISLGAWCQVAEQFRRHNFPRTPSPFEWTVSTWSSMMAVIGDDGRRLGHDLTINADGTDVFCQAYGLLHPHDFGGEHDGAGPLLGLAPDQLANNRAKYARKMDGFRRACRSTEGRIAFVRLGGEAEPAVAWPYLHDREPLNTEQVNALAVLLTQYCGHSNFDLFIIRYAAWHPFEENARLHPNVRMMELPYPEAPVDWYGHDHDCSKVYADAGIIISHPNDVRVSEAA